MYTLRRISGDGVEMNHALGNQYTVIDREKNPQEFERTANLHYGHFESGDDGVKTPVKADLNEYKNVHAFVSGRGGEYIQPLYSNQQAYIMTDSGKTFDNLSFKG